ncbi:MAG: hypothetical protein EOP48_10780 [Sphingobacteriales bacterium]|nr:MAG: hypothetical protein EOP48_10780 [Sphingobacteriales bacterium]
MNLKRGSETVMGKWTGLIKLAISIIVVMHLIITPVSYFSKTSPSSGIFNIKNYTEIFLFQKWNFFAPIPGTITEKILINCNSEKHPTKLDLDPAEEILNQTEYIPFHPNYKRTYVIRDLTLAMIKKAAFVKKTTCKPQEFEPAKLHLAETISESSNYLKDLTSESLDLCPEGNKKLKRTQEYRRIVSLSKKFCRSKYPDDPLESWNNLELVVLQKHPFPLEEKELKTNRTHKISRLSL